MKFKKIVKTASVAVAVMISLSNVSNAEIMKYYPVKVAGKSRVETSIEASRFVKSDKLILADANSFPDALSSNNLAIKYKAKLLLVDNKTDLTSLLDKINPTKIYVVGGKININKNLLGEHLDKAERIAGKNRYETNEKTLEGFNEVGVADGRNYPDALSASGLLKKHNLGLKLVDGSKLYSTNRIIKYTFGGKSSVKYPKGRVIAGKNRYETSKKIASEIGDIDSIMFVSGKVYADALSATNLVIAKDKPAVILAEKGDVKKYEDKERYLIGNRAEFDAKWSGITKTFLPEYFEKENYDTKEDTLIKNTRESRAGSVETIGAFGSGVKIEGNTIIVSPKDDEVASSENPSVNNFNPINRFNFSTDDTEQSKFDNDLLKNLINGVNGHLKTPNNYQINQGIKALYEGAGFRPLYYSDFSVQGYYFGEDYYDPSFIDSLIIKSGVLNYKDKETQAKLLAKYLIWNYNYSYSGNREELITNSGAMSLAKNGEAQCAGFTFAYNQALLRLGIPASMVTGPSSLYGGKHIEPIFYVNGKFMQLNVTGIGEKSRKNMQIETGSFQNINDEQIKSTIHEYDKEHSKELRESQLKEVLHYFK